MKIPKKLHLSGLTIQVKQDITPSEAETLAGQWDSGRHVIRLDPGLGEQAKMQAFLHEVVHAISTTYGCSIKHADVDRLASALIELIPQLGRK